MWYNFPENYENNLGNTLPNEPAGDPKMSDEGQTTPVITGYMQSFERLFGESELGTGRGVGSHRNIWRPPTDLFETEDALIVSIEIAGMLEGSLSVSIADRELTVSGFRQRSETRGAYHQMEIRYGEFRTDVHLPTVVDEDRIEGSYNDCFLTVTMPKRGAHRVKVVLDPHSQGED